MQSGKCKLDLGKNPIIQVTPLGRLPQVTSQDKVAAWLQPAEPEANRRMDTGEATPSTSTGVRANLPPITSKPLRTARAQIRAMAATAVTPNDSIWNRRNVFNPGLPLGHAQQKPVSGISVQDDFSSPPPSPRPNSVGVVDKGPSPPPRDLDSPHSTVSRTTILAQPLSLAPSSSDLSLRAQTGPRAPQSLESPHMAL